MTTYEAGEIVLVHYPFTDLSSAKKRPAVVLSGLSYLQRHGDVVLMPLTSRPETEPALTLSQWRAAGLIKPTWVKPIVGTVSATLIQRRLGQLAAADHAAVRAARCR